MLHEAARIRPRGMFYLSHHPWVAVILLALVVMAVLYLRSRQ